MTPSPNQKPLRAPKHRVAEQMSAGDIEELHKAACATKQTFYEDPATGLLVFTSFHLSQRPCCHSGCRHCPYSTTAAPPANVLSGCLDDLPEKVDVHFWSGGKDSFLTIRSNSDRDIVLLTTYDAAASRVAMQDVAIQDVIRQAKTLGFPLLGVPVGDDYVRNIGAALKKLRDAGLEIQRLVFGDLHLAHIRKWRETELTRLGVELHFPLWKVPYVKLMKWLKESGVVIRVSAVDRDNHLLRGIKVGDIFDDDFVRSLPDQVDNFGENGEFHTLVEVWNKRP